MTTHYDRITYQDASDMGLDLICETVRGIADGTVVLEDQDEKSALFNLANAAFGLAKLQQDMNYSSGRESGYLFECMYLDCEEIPMYYTFYPAAEALYREIENDELGDVVELSTGVFASDLGDW